MTKILWFMSYISLHKLSNLHYYISHTHTSLITIVHPILCIKPLKAPYILFYYFWHHWLSPTKCKEHEIQSSLNQTPINLKPEMFFRIPIAWTMASWSQNETAKSFFEISCQLKQSSGLQKSHKNSLK